MGLPGSNGLLGRDVLDKLNSVINFNDRTLFLNYNNERICWKLLEIKDHIENINEQDENDNYKQNKNEEQNVDSNEKQVEENINEQNENDNDKQDYNEKRNNNEKQNINGIAKQVEEKNILKQNQDDEQLIEEKSTMQDYKEYIGEVLKSKRKMKIWTMRYRLLKI